MKVILLENITPLGQLGDVVNVRAGYARNYLFPQGKAERAGEEAIKRFAERRAELEARQEQQQAELRAASEALNGYLLQLTARASPDGNLYGSITPQIVAQALNAQKLIAGVNIRRGQVILPNDEPIKSLGEHAVEINVRADLRATIKVSILTETGEASSRPTETTDEDTGDNGNENKVNQ